MCCNSRKHMQVDKNKTSIAPSINTTKHSTVQPHKQALQNQKTQSSTVHTDETTEESPYCTLSAAWLHSL